MAATDISAVVNAATETIPDLRSIGLGLATVPRLYRQCQNL